MSVVFQICPLYFLRQASSEGLLPEEWVSGDFSIFLSHSLVIIATVFSYCSLCIFSKANLYCLFLLFYYTSDIIVEWGKICHAVDRGQRKTFQTQFSPFTFVLVLGMELRLPVLYGAFLSVLSHTASPLSILSEIIKFFLFSELKLLKVLLLQNFHYKIIVCFVK